MLRAYKTILEPAETELTEKKSRFIAYFAPISGEGDALSVLERVRKTHSAASHNCYAFRILGDSVYERYSDDGEPGGTAGLPMLGVLSGSELYNIIVVVTRYFGGVLLGTGGLARAYSGAVKLALAEAEIIEKKLFAKLRILCDYSSYGKISHELLRLGAVVNNTVFESEAELLVFCESRALEDVSVAVTDITSGRALVFCEGEVFGFAHNGKVIF